MWFNYIIIYDGIFVISSQAIGSRNLLKSVAKQREAQQQQLQALITEKKMQLERFFFILSTEYKKHSYLISS